MGAALIWLITDCAGVFTDVTSNANLEASLCLANYPELLKYVKYIKSNSSLAASLFLLLLASPLSFYLWYLRNHDKLESIEQQRGSNNFSAFSNALNLFVEKGNKQANAMGLSLLASLRQQGLFVKEIDIATPNRDLSGIRLEYANLKGVNLTNADLQKVKLQEASLQNINLTGSNLQNADLSVAKLQNATLWFAKLQNADLCVAKLQNADLWCANIQNADLEGTILQTTNLQTTNLCSANLCSADLQNANLQYAKLQNADLQNANLRDAKLNGVVFTIDENYFPSGEIDRDKVENLLKDPYIKKKKHSS